MNNHLIIGSVSEHLRNLLWSAIQPHAHFGLRNERDIVFTSPAVRLGGHSSQLSLWLYHTSFSPILRNVPSTRGSNPVVETPALQLDLHYLITPLATDADEDIHLFETVVRTLSSHPVVTLERPSDQPQQLRITPRADSPFDRAAIWQALRTDFHLAAAYDVSGLHLAIA